jgi:signal recognition particle receptor subunit beta
MHSIPLVSDIALVRAETQNEVAARRAAEAPVLAFLVIETFPKSGAAVVCEFDLPGHSRSKIARDIACGQWDNPHRVLFIDEAAGICRDASAEIAELLASDPDLSPSPPARRFCARSAA